LRGYLARPAGVGPWPGVIAIHESFGLNDIVRRQADRLAAAGYLTFAPDLFSDGGAARCVMGTFRAMFAGHGKPFADIEAARMFVHGHRDCTGKVGIIGFCMGGGFALLLAPGHGFDASSVNYGTVPKSAESMLAGACPIVGSFGGKDRTLRGAAARLEAALTRLGVDHDVTEYADAGHSFLNDHDSVLFRVAGTLMGGGHHEPSAADARRRILAFFARHLGSAG
jgi:carboxymethylenebutenolidase